MNLNDIRYGNPPIVHINAWQTGKGKELLDKCEQLGLLDTILKMVPPQNDSEETIQELVYLTELTQNATPEDVKLCKALEEQHYAFFSKYCEKFSISISVKELQEMIVATDGLLHYVKNYFNRPRPYQLAYELKLPLYPIIETNANSASYPSGHSLDFLVMCHNIAKRHPEHADKMTALYERIKHIRELSGVHYPSDRTTSELIYKLLVENNLL